MVKRDGGPRSGGTEVQMSGNHLMRFAKPTVTTTEEKPTRQIITHTMEAVDSDDDDDNFIPPTIPQDSIQDIDHYDTDNNTEEDTEIPVHMVFVVPV